MNFSFDVIKEMWLYGLNIQLSSFLQLLQEPISKGFMAYFGGSAVAGIYEVAYQIVFRLRSLLININYAIVSTVARITEKENEDTDKIYLNNINLILLWGIYIFSSATILSGGIGWVYLDFTNIIDIDDILIIFRLFWKSSDGASIFFIHWRWKSKKEYSDSLINSIIKHYPIIYFRGFI